VGRWGEALVHQLLLVTHKDAEVEWLNADQESLAPYDLIIRPPGCRTVFVEVKATSSADRVSFPLSLQEWEFAINEPRPAYHVYRVYQAGSQHPRVEIFQVLQHITHWIPSVFAFPLPFLRFPLSSPENGPHNSWRFLTPDESNGLTSPPCGPSTRRCARPCRTYLVCL
jgi:hypothetical protein